MKTSAEEGREQHHDAVVKALQELLEKNYDAENGFKKAIDDTENSRLKDFLKRQAVQRNRFATEIDFEIRALNESPTESGSVAATLHRTWIDLKSALGGNDDQEVLEECIRGEKASIKEYEEVLKEHKVPAKIEQVLSRQLDDIRETLDKVKSLEDLEKLNY